MEGESGPKIRLKGVVDGYVILPIQLLVGPKGEEVRFVESSLLIQECKVPAEILLPCT